jgi:hypothetical protein
MFGVILFQQNGECKPVEPSGVTWFGSKELAEQYYGWQKMSGQFPIGEWSTDDYGREVMVDILHYDKIMSPEFEIEGKARLPYATQLVKSPVQLRGAPGVTVKSGQRVSS